MKIPFWSKKKEEVGETKPLPKPKKEKKRSVSAYEQSIQRREDYRKKLRRA